MLFSGQFTASHVTVITVKLLNVLKWQIISCFNFMQTVCALKDMCHMKGAYTEYFKYALNWIANEETEGRNNASNVLSNFQNGPAKRNICLPLPPCGKCASPLLQTQVQENKHCRCEDKLTNTVTYRWIFIINNEIIVVASMCELCATSVAYCKGCWTKVVISTQYWVVRAEMGFWLFLF